MLEQDKEHEAHRFLSKIDSSLLNITDFSLFSIGIILSRLDEPNVLKKFYKDVIYESKVNIIRLNPDQLLKLSEVSSNFSLDFDDSYQYLASKEYGLKLISFDDDFDETDLERYTLEDVT